jgi:uncharacterized protein with HEPN domain
MDRYSLKYIQDMYDSIESIEEMLSEYERKYEVYNSTKILQLAVERNFEIIGEAATKLIKHNPDVNITNVKKIISLRNLIAHAYDSITNVDIWNVIINHLPVLKTELKFYLDKYPDV